MTFQDVYSLVVIVTAIAVAVDASRLGARRGALGGGFLDMGPAGWFFAVLLFWIVTLPCYLAVRPRHVRRAHGVSLYPALGGSMPAMAGFAPTGPTAFEPQHHPGSPAGWYTSPSGFGIRWWDGAAWTEHHRPS